MVSVWHPEPPPWFECFSTSSTALEPPKPTDKNPESVEAQTFKSTQQQLPSTESVSSSLSIPSELDSDINIKQKLKSLKQSVIDKYKEIFTIIGTEDPSEATSPTRIDNLHAQIESNVAAFHQLIKDYRRHQGVENMIQLLELEINDYDRAIEDLGNAQKALHEAIILKEDA